MMVFLSGYTFAYSQEECFWYFRKNEKRLKIVVCCISQLKKKRKWSRGRNKKEDDYGYEYERFLVIIH